LTGKRFLCRPLATVRVDDTSRLVHAPGAQRAGQLENGLLALAEGLDSWATFDEHLRRLGSFGLSLSARDFTQALESLQEVGALWLEEDFLGALAQQAPRQPAPITRLAWCTRERPDILARGMRSFLARDFDPGTQQLLVCDDSSLPGAAAATRESALRAVAESAAPSARLRYIGAAEKQRIRETLKKHGSSRGIAPETVDFILGSQVAGISVEGANRNFSLLLTTGKAFHSTDDDTLADAFGDAPDGLELSSASSPTVSDFFSGEDQHASLPAAGSGILALHGTYLGRGVGGMVRDLSSDAVVLSSCGSAFSRELAAEEAFVAVTSAGALGDSGLGNPRLIFHQEGERRARYVEDVAAYKAVRLSRSVFRRAERPTLTSSGGFVTMDCAIDNRGFIPPFFPFGRNSDGLLGVTLRFCRPSGLIMHLPQAIRHAPPGVRTFSEEDLHAFVPRMCDFLIHASGAARTGPFVTSTRERVAALASHLRSFSRLARSDFDDAVRLTWMSFGDRYISTMQGRLDEYGYSPEPWAADVQRHLESMLEFLGKSGPLLPREFPAAMPSSTIEEQRELFRSSIGLYAEALDAWETIREIALEESLFENG
jgi:hypothetical protein